MAEIESEPRPVLILISTHISQEGTGGQDPSLSWPFPWAVLLIITHPSLGGGLCKAVAFVLSQLLGNGGGQPSAENVPMIRDVIKPRGLPPIVLTSLSPNPCRSTNLLPKHPPDRLLFQRGPAYKVWGRLGAGDQVLQLQSWPCWLPSQGRPLPSFPSLVSAPGAPALLSCPSAPGFHPPCLCPVVPCFLPHWSVLSSRDLSLCLPQVLSCSRRNGW